MSSDFSFNLDDIISKVKSPGCLDRKWIPTFLMYASLVMLTVTTIVTLWTLSLVGSLETEATFSPNSQANEVVFYEHKDFEGFYQRFTKSKNCVNFNEVMAGHASSATLNGHCIILYRNTDCSGEKMKFGECGVDEKGCCNNNHRLYFCPTDWNDKAKSFAYC